MSYELEVKRLDKILAKLQKFPDKLREVMQVGMDASLSTIHENVPSYPPQPADTDYIRTGTLGRTLGANGAQPDIYEVTNEGWYFQGRFGTRLGYAPYVIGDYVTEQANHMRHWWTLPQDVARRSIDKINRIWNGIAKEVGAWLKDQT